MAFIFSIASPALAGKQGIKVVEHLDTDGDGQVSFEEFQPRNDRSHRMLELADQDGDGALTLDEMEQARAAKMVEKQIEMAERMAAGAERMEQNFIAMDTDGSGTVTPMEMRQHSFNKLDKNEDGYITADEFKQATPHNSFKNKHQRGGTG
jgi:hypothetical protein